MSRLKEAFRRLPQQHKREPGLLELHLAMVPLMLLVASKITIVVRGKSPKISGIITYESERGELPSHEERRDETHLVFPKGVVAGVTINGREHLVTHTGKSKRIIVGGTIKKNQVRGSFMDGGKSFTLNSRSRNSRRAGLGSGITGVYEPD